MSGEQLFINRPLPGAQINQSHPLAKGLVGCWLMNEQAGIRCIDSSPYGNHGTMVGFGVPANSRSSQGIKFDGVDDCIDIANQALFNFYGGSCSVWVKSNDYIGSHIIVRTPQYVLFSSGMSFNVFASSVSQGWHGAGSKSDSIDLSVWDNFVYSYNSTNNLTIICKNGVLIYSSYIITTGNLSMVDTVFTVGREGSNYWNGSINDMRIYSRALNKDEIKELYLNPYAMFMR